MTGRLVAAHLAARAAAHGVGWAAAGRDPERVRRALPDTGGPPGAVLTADVTDPASLAALAAGTRVVLNLAGPYTERAEPVIAACVAAGTSYADLTGETPLAARMVRRWHAPAQRAGVKVVQVAGFEALPFDVAVLLAAERAERDGAVLAEVETTFTVTTAPRTLRLSDMVSGGTLQSLALILAEADRPHLTDPAQLLPDSAADAAGAVPQRTG